MAAEDHQNKRPRLDDDVIVVSEDNHQNKRARLILDDEVNYEDSEHTFYLDLPPYSQKDKLVKFVADSEKKGWPRVSMSFSDGNFAGIENIFTLQLYCDKDGKEKGDTRLFVSISVKLEHVPWKVNEKLDSITLNFARISFENKLDDSSSDVLPFYIQDVKEGFRCGRFVVAILNWDSNYDGIKVTINVSKRAEVSAKIVPSKPMKALPNSNTLPSNAMNTSFAKYFLCATTSDCKVEAGSKVFPAHYLVLAELIGSFKRLFKAENKIWKVNGFKPEVVEEFLEYAYKGTSKNLTLAQNTEVLMDLCRMAQDYEVVPLKAQCEELLKNLINTDNVVELFRLGFDCDLESLMAAAKIYFNRFKPQILPDSDALSDFLAENETDVIYKLTIE